MRNIQSLANIPQCKVGNLPMTYLGMPLGTLYKTPMLHGHGHEHDTDTDTGIRQFLKNKDTTRRLNN